MKKKSLVIISIAMICLLGAVVFCGCGKKKDKADNDTVQENTSDKVSKSAEDTKEKIVSDVEDSRDKKAEYDALVDIYERFIDGEVIVFTDRHEFTKKNEEGEEFSYFGNNSGMTIDEFIAKVQETESSGGLQKPKLKNVSYSIIDCGADGVPELALKAEFDQYNDILTCQYVIKAFDRKLELCYMDYAFATMGVELHTLNEINAKIDKREKELGISSELKQDKTINWKPVDMAVFKADTPLVVNNNGHFVMVDDKIYYHVVDADSMGSSALFGRYADIEAGRTILYEYDPTTGENEIKYFDYTSGPIAFEGDTLYNLTYFDDDLDWKADDKTGVCGMSVANGEMCELEREGNTLLGASSDASFIATYHYSYENYEDIKYICVYQNGELITKTDVMDYQDVVGIGSEDIFYIGGNPQKGYSLIQLNAYSGETINLGSLPYVGDWNGYVDECIIEGDKVYFTYSKYEGTGNFFVEGYYIQALIGKAKSIRYIDMPNNDNGYGEPLMAPFAVINGKMVKADGKPGTCEVNDLGILGYYDEKGRFERVAGGFAYEETADEGNKQVEIAELIDGYIYLIYNVNSRAPEDDIGWRYAYRRDNTYIYRVNIETGTKEELVKQVSPRG